MRTWSERRTGSVSASPRRLAGFAACLLVAGVALHGCAATDVVAPDAPAAASGTKVTPQRNWADAVLYFVILDRFADGSGANDTNVARANPGGFHGGDFVGLTRQLDEVASLGATAIWLTPVVRQIDFCPPAQPPTGITVPGGWF
ncbi:MAG: Periplasmic alpha-amylase [Steroidobacteraceae bacterium]|nr:Periplasmic alpha-amylase [Steroidobacteraceae bacterium]